MFGDSLILIWMVLIGKKRARNRKKEKETTRAYFKGVLLYGSSMITIGGKVRLYTSTAHYILRMFFFFLFL